MKLTTGILVRNKDKNKDIGFFPRDLQLNARGFWNLTLVQAVIWSRRRWKENYKLEPPAPGEFFDVEIEL